MPGMITLRICIAWGAGGSLSGVAFEYSKISKSKLFRVPSWIKPESSAHQ